MPVASLKSVEDHGGSASYPWQLSPIRWDLLAACLKRVGPLAVTAGLRVGEGALKTEH